ncbi:Hypothetical protein RM25_1593 [Propionibacterium freudenreichii subsp. freudenreichii]|nr:Hypothetical protein RM25_1593 [Propionibacterium freudenreichii subsp. freudenreichii]SCQ45616.1 Hypothetical protein PFR_JS7-1_666 [Propionibacterium freudenreichii]SCQ50210.1 Hypothetical protein PFR_JS7-2_666 [Propionibacterium freudenreichii]SCQ67892.1 Hypothetical protein PFR_JS17-1_659 [Propionibacterium freudenreichii]
MARRRTVGSVGPTGKDESRPRPQEPMSSDIILSIFLTPTREERADR